MRSFFLLIILSLTLVLFAGCRTSKSGSYHTDIDIHEVQSSRSDSVDFREKFARYLHEEESDLKMQIVEYYPPEPGDTASKGAVKRVLDLDYKSKSNNDSAINVSHLTITSDTTNRQLDHAEVTDGSYKLKKAAWYEPFIPYLIFFLIFIFLYFFRKE